MGWRKLLQYITHIYLSIKDKWMLKRLVWIYHKYWLTFDFKYIATAFLRVSSPPEKGLITFQILLWCWAGKSRLSGPHYGNWWVKKGWEVDRFQQMEICCYHLCIRKIILLWNQYMNLEMYWFHTIFPILL